MKPLSTDINFLEFLGLQESQKILPMTDYLDEVKNYFAGNVRQTGERMPWEKTHDLIRFRPCEVSLWAGYNGHGKSLILGQVLAHFPQSVQCLIASLEMAPRATIARMIRQTLAGGFPSDTYVDQFGEATDNLYIYDQTDTTDANVILGMVHYAAKELGMNHVVIDSLMKCGISPEDLPKQKDFVDRLCWAAKTHEIHIHLVHHIRKGVNELDPPGKSDIKGAGEIVDLVDNVIITHRNKRKELKIQAQKPTDDPLDEKVTKAPDVFVDVAKQRHDDFEGKIGLGFHKASQSYTERPGGNPVRWRGQ